MSNLSVQQPQCWFRCGWELNCWRPAVTLVACLYLVFIFKDLHNNDNTYVSFDIACHLCLLKMNIALNFSWHNHVIADLLHICALTRSYIIFCDKISTFSYSSITTLLNYNCKGNSACSIYCTACLCMYDEQAFDRASWVVFYRW